MPHGARLNTDDRLRYLAAVLGHDIAASSQAKPNMSRCCSDDLRGAAVKVGDGWPGRP